MEGGGVDQSHTEDVFDVLHVQAKSELATLVDAIETKLGGPVECLRALHDSRKLGIRKDDVLDIEVKAKPQEKAA